MFLSDKKKRLFLVTALTVKSDNTATQLHFSEVLFAIFSLKVVVRNVVVLSVSVHFTLRAPRLILKVCLQNLKLLVSVFLVKTPCRNILALLPAR